MGRSADPELARHVARSIVARLRDHGHTAYFAGGCVRDELLGLHPTDYDIATDATPTRVRELFNRTNEVGAAFGVMLVADDGSLSRGYAGQPGKGSVVVEVATFRADGTYSDARRPDSVRFSDAPSDAARRDFTINALFLDPLAPPDPVPKHPHGPPTTPSVRGRVIDYVGGLNDLHNRVIRAVGEPDTRLTEDHLRALRAVRFSARLGFEIDAGTRAAITRHASELRGVSRERIGEELRRMLAHPNRAIAAAILESLGLDSAVFGSTRDGADSALPMLAALESHWAGRVRSPGDSELGNVVASAPGLGVTLAAWALDRTGGIAGIRSRAVAEVANFCQATASSLRWSLCMSNEETQQLSDVLSTVHVLVLRFDSMTKAERKRAAAKTCFGEALAILAGGDAARSDRILFIYKELWRDGVGISPPALVTGDDLVAAGLKPGPRFKGVLDQVYDAQLEGRVMSKSEAMELARRLCV